eukprot:Selendium_serpulae@DN2513_c0_g1_i1.p1
MAAVWTSLVAVWGFIAIAAQQSTVGLHGIRFPDFIMLGFSMASSTMATVAAIAAVASVVTICLRQIYELNNTSLMARPTRKPKLIILPTHNSKSKRSVEHEKHSADESKEGRLSKSGEDLGEDLEMIDDD